MLPQPHETLAQQAFRGALDSRGLQKQCAFLHSDALYKCPQILLWKLFESDGCAALQQVNCAFVMRIGWKNSSKFKSLLRTPNKSRELLTKARLSP
jgi:hypothetical protein